MAEPIERGIQRLTRENYRELAARARSQALGGRFTSAPKDAAEFLARCAVCPWERSRTSVALIMHPSERQLRRQCHVVKQLVDHLWNDLDNPVPEAERELTTIEVDLENLLWQFSSDRCVIFVLLRQPEDDLQERIDEVLKMVLGSPRPSDGDDDYATSLTTFAASYMNNAKWRRAFTILSEHFEGRYTATWKFINSDREFFWPLPGSYSLMESHLGAGFEPIEYRWIEWIRIPATSPAGIFKEKLHAVRAALEQAGNSQLQQDEQGLTLFGYGT